MLFMFFCGKTLTTLEIWGKAHRESARRPKSDWGEIRGVKFSRHQSRGPNSNALANANV